MKFTARTESRINIFFGGGGYANSLPNVKKKPIRNRAQR